VLAAWGALVACVVIGFFGDVLDLPTWVADLSPFQHTPELPVADLTLVPLAALTAVAAGLTTAGLRGFRRRDVG
jgi:ABC-2 type transport system permease protein